MKTMGDPTAGKLRVDFNGAELDEIVIGNWFHLERMGGRNKRNWSLILTDVRA